MEGTEGAAQGNWLSAPPGFTFRFTVGRFLWWAGAVWALLGLLLSWDWMASIYPDLRFPDQRWGDVLPQSWHDLGLGVMVAVTLLFWVSKSRLQNAPGTSSNRTQTLCVISRYLSITVGATMILLLVFSSYLSVRHWWLIFPAEAGAGAALLCMVIGSLLVPGVTSPSYRHIIEPKRRTTLASAGFVLALALAAQFTPALFNHTQMVARETAGEGAGSVEAEDGISTLYSAGGIVQSTLFGPQWSRAWRGAHEPQLVPAFTTESVAVLLQQATPSRPRLILLDRASGEIQASYSSNQAEAIGLLARLDAKDEDATYQLFNQTLVFSGQHPVTISREGERLPWYGDISASTWAASNGTLSKGLMGVDLPSGTDWLVGSSGGCTRVVATDDEGAWVATAGAIMMVQVCNREPSGANWGAAPGMSAPAPLSGTIFAISPKDGTLLWEADLPGWDNWLKASAFQYPASRFKEIPLHFAATNANATRANSDADMGAGTVKASSSLVVPQVTVTLGSHNQDFNVESGPTR